jgi:peptide/nickel transport system permease protein
VPFSQDPVANLKSMVIPIIVAATGSFVVYFRVFRTDLISTYQEEFITMARSKGLKRRRITWRHAVRPSMVPLLSTIGINVPTLIAGLFIIDIKLGIPGLGEQLYVAVLGRNYLTIQTIVMVVATITVVFNFAIDLSFGFIDPRITRD